MAPIISKQKKNCRLRKLELKGICRPAFGTTEVSFDLWAPELSQNARRHVSKSGVRRTYAPDATIKLEFCLRSALKRHKAA